MKVFVSILIIVGVVFGLRSLVSYYHTVNKTDGEVATQPASRVQRGEDLAGLPPTFEASLQEAQKTGAAALGNWLDLYRSYVTDPRLAWIELDYVVLLSKQDPKEARTVFSAVKSRISPSSPVYERIKALGKTYD